LKIGFEKSEFSTKDLCGEDYISSLTEESPGSGIYKIPAPKKDSWLIVEFSSNGDSDVDTGFQLKLFAQLDTSVTTATTTTASTTTTITTTSITTTSITATSITATSSTTTTTTTTTGTPTNCDCGIKPSVKIVGMHTHSDIMVIHWEPNFEVPITHNCTHCNNLGAYDRPSL
jgi:hypothetical protein